MPPELDHLFVMTAPDAPAANLLVEAGFTEGASRTHPGQGTTNRRFFFDNAMVEFLWVHDPDEAESDVVRPTHLLPRWHRRDSGGSPFGICFRPTQASETPPFTTWDYEPPYLPPTRQIKVADNVEDIAEPFLFVLPWGQSPEDPPAHDAGVRRLTGVTIHTPENDSPSEALRAIETQIRFEEAARHHMTLEFDDERQEKTLELSPAAPLTIRY